MEDDTETCLVMEIQENELGELMLVERPRERAFSDNRFCVVDCKVEPSEGEDDSVIADEEDGEVQENIEIVYLPDYEGSGPVVLKHETFGEEDEVDDPGPAPRVPKRTGAACRETRLRSNPNVILKHQATTRPRDRWTLKLDAKDFAHTKTISSVTTIHTRPTRVDGLENETMPDVGLVRPNVLPHKCKYCDRAFRQSVSLQIHSTLHSQTPPDGCHVS